MYNHLRPLADDGRLSGTAKAAKAAKVAVGPDTQALRHQAKSPANNKGQRVLRHTRRVPRQPILKTVGASSAFNGSSRAVQCFGVP
ncbi:hypothetical protein E4U17_002814 [Claviceps sp. LM77 group G4]|nr:hypothetical protein E4U33_001324 [Claviceps sp. LM78 group G4]KAG6055672.1 hypothetical protein E4U17_002814 [Claviceps sp. LM77 group G4]KAG6077053.1 hypothetical protein E4U16_002459 [Claviceps sp. LM84 group G4]